MPNEDRTALCNPDPGKMGATIERAKYDRMRSAILAALGHGGSLTYTQLAEAVERELGDSFPGSVRWYVTAVKLDLEARGDLHRTTVRGRDYVTVATPTLVPEERR
jgi:DNA-binding transcriptional ArsR family regulator